MGAACCCFHVPDEQDDDSTSRNCSCPKCFFSKLINKRRTSAIPPPNHQAPSSNSQAVSGSGYGAVPNNARSLLLQEHRNVARARQEKGTSGSRVQPVPEGKIVVSISTPQQTYETSAKLLAARTNSGVAYKYPSPHREEECPTCLEEYTLENPKITAECSHAFHLSCIYEWNERSPECPVCRKRARMKGQNNSLT